MMNRDLGGRGRLNSNSLSFSCSFAADAFSLRFQEVCSSEKSRLHLSSTATASGTSVATAAGNRRVRSTRREVRRRRGRGRAASPRPRPLRPRKFSHLARANRPSSRATGHIAAQPTRRTPERQIRILAAKLSMFRHRWENLVRSETIAPTTRGRRRAEAHCRLSRTRARAGTRTRSSTRTTASASAHAPSASRTRG